MRASLWVHTMSVGAQVCHRIYAFSYFEAKASAGECRGDYPVNICACFSFSLQVTDTRILLESIMDRHAGHSCIRSTFKDRVRADAEVGVKAWSSLETRNH